MRNLIALVVLALVVPAQAQRHSIVVPYRSDTPPSEMQDNELWIANSDFRMYTYFDTLGVLLGAEQTILATHTNADASGLWRIGVTTTNDLPGGEQGFYADRLYKIMSVQAISADVLSTAACSTFILSDADTVLTLVWDVNQESWTPGGSGWASPADRVVIAAGEVMSIDTGSGGAVLPDYPTMWIRMREEKALGP